MRFSEDGICELPSLTSVDECDAYVLFLKSERNRHLDALDSAEDEALLWSAVAQGAPIRTTRCSIEFGLASSAFYDSAATRHRQDLAGIAKRVKEIEAHKATLEVK